MFEVHPLLITIVITLFYNPRSHHWLRLLLSLTTKCSNLPQDVLEYLCNDTHINNGAKAIPDGIVMGVDVDSMNLQTMLNSMHHIISDLAETMTKRLLEGIPLI